MEPDPELKGKNQDSVLAFLILKEQKNGKMLVTFCWETLMQNNRDTVESAEGEKCNLCFICLRI